MLYSTSSTRFITFLLWILYLFVCAIVIFMKGFLQDRYVLNKKSVCTVLDSCELDHGEKIESIQTNRIPQFCTRTKQIKGIIIVIDALRYDFIKFSNNNSKPENFQNKFKIVNEVPAKNSRLYKFLAHPPTTTYQRLHGLMTGSLPTFVDIGNNFGSTNVKEDNLIDQFKSHDMKVIFMGDDTWTRIYPNGFFRSFPFPSFNVWDLDNEDNSVKKLLFPEMKRNDWDVIIAHFLGVDHCGHTLGPGHPEMVRKLTEMNEVVTKVILKMDDSTILFVLGDHGMTSSGVHAGDSMDEISSALFVYSKNEELMSGFLEEEQIYQIDLVPTIANLFGLPIPFSNLGTTLLVNLNNNLKCRLINLWSNVNQVTEYIKEYSSSKKIIFSEGERRYLLQNYNQLKSKYESDLTTSSRRKFFNEAREYLKEVRELCQKLWNQFDLGYMSVGIVFMFLTLTVGCFIISIKRKLLENILFGSIFWFVFLILIFTFFTFSQILCLNIISNLNMTFICLTFLCSVGIIFRMTTNYVRFIPSSCYSIIKVKNKRNVIHITLVVVIMILMISSLSNSYIVEESSVVAFLLVSLLWMAFSNMRPVSISSKKIRKKEINLKIFVTSLRGKVFILSILVSVLIRLSSVYWHCRDEQVPKCVIFKELPKPDVCVISVFLLALYMLIFKSILFYFGNLYGSSVVFLLSRYCPLFCLVCCGLFWVVGSLSNDIKTSLFSSSQLHYFSQVSFYISIVSLIVFYIKPLFISLKNDYKFERDSFIRHGVSTNQKVSGLATVYSAMFINICPFILLILSILLGGHRAPTVILMLTTTSLIAIILALLKLDKPKYSSPSDMTWLSVLCWGLSSSVFFYGTGHQTSFSSIQWESAGIFGDITSTFFPGILVALNTFSSQIFHSLFLPVLYIMTYTVSSVCPSIASDCFLLKRNEMDIYYEKGSRIHSMFSLVLRYLLYLSFRVFMSMLCAFIHMRHLLAWNVFAPKLIFESFAFLISLPFLLIGFLFVERISRKLDTDLKSLENL